MSDKTNLSLLEDIYVKLNNINNKSFIYNFNILIEKLYYDTENSNKLFEICILTIKKLTKNIDFLNNIQQKFLCEDYWNKLKESSDKFVVWLNA